MPLWFRALATNSEQNIFLFLLIGTLNLHITNPKKLKPSFLLLVLKVSMYSDRRLYCSSVTSTAKRPQLISRLSFRKPESSGSSLKPAGSTSLEYFLPKLTQGKISSFRERDAWVNSAFVVFLIMRDKIVLELMRNT